MIEKMTNREALVKLRASFKRWFADDPIALAVLLVEEENGDNTNFKNLLIMMKEMCEMALEELNNG